MNETLHTELRKKFEEQYYLITEMDYYWTAKDSANLKQLITKLTFHVKKKKETAIDIDIKEAFALVLQCITNVPQLKWYKESFSVAIINSKLNEIINIIKTNGVKKDRSENINRLIEGGFARPGTRYTE